MHIDRLRRFSRYAPRVLRYAGWFAGGLIATAAFFALGVLFRVLMGPVSLGPLSGELHSALAAELPGLDVRFDGAALAWTRSEARINLVILGTRVFDRQGRIIAQAPQAEIALAAAPLFRGNVVVSRIALLGVQLTLVRSRAGVLRLGIRAFSIRDRLSANRLEGALFANTHASLSRICRATPGRRPAPRRRP